MPGDHNFESCRFRLEIELRKVVQHVDGDPAKFDDFGVGSLAGPRSLVDIAANCRQRGNLGQSFKNFRSAYVPRMDDVLRPAQRCDCLGSKQSVRVGNNADSDGILNSQFRLPASGFRLFCWPS